MTAKRLVFTIFLMVAVLLSSCAKTPTTTPAQQPENTVAPATKAPEPTQAEAASKSKIATFIWTQEFDTLNPLYTQMWFSTVTMQIYLAWAWEYDEKNEPHPVLVKELPSQENGGISADGKTITMKLRDDIKWSDNEPITADDFIFTYQMAVDPNNTVSSTYPYDRVKTMEAPDPHTVVITFEEPFAPWEATFWKGILPAHVLKPVYEKDKTLNNADWNRAPTVGCGPYIFKEWESGSYARFVRNPNYWGKQPNLDEIYFRFVPDDASQVAALKAGDGDLGTFIAYSDVPALKEAGLNIVTEPSGGNEGWFFLINKDLSNPALLDVRVRQAIAMAFDRASLNKDILLGLTKPPASFWDALPYYNDPPIQDYPYDPEGAKKLLDEAGWKDSNGDGVREKDGTDLVLRYGTNIREIRQDAQAIAQQQLAQVGIKLELSSYETDTFFADFEHDGPAATGKLDIMEWSDYPAFPDPDIYYWLCSEIPSKENPTGTNWFFMCDEELDSLIKLQTTQMNRDERRQTIYKINQIFHDKMYWLGLWQDPDVWAVGPRLTGVKFSGVTPFFNIVDWDIKQ